MVNEYNEKLYEPAHMAWDSIRMSHFSLARERAHWSANVNRVWNNVAFVNVGPGPEAAVTSGSAIPIDATINLAGLSPSDVRVEAVVGRVGPTGQLEDSEVITLPAVEQNDGAWLFSKEFVPHQTGLLGYGLRVSPNHTDNPLTRPCNALLKWGNP